MDTNGRCRVCDVVVVSGETVGQVTTNLKARIHPRRRAADWGDDKRRQLADRKCFWCPSCQDAAGGSS